MSFEFPAPATTPAIAAARGHPRRSSAPRPTSPSCSFCHSVHCLFLRLRASAVKHQAKIAGNHKACFVSAFSLSAFHFWASLPPCGHPVHSVHSVRFERVYPSALPWAFMFRAFSPPFGCLPIMNFRWSLLTSAATVRWFMVVTSCEGFL